MDHPLLDMRHIIDRIKHSIRKKETILSVSDYKSTVQKIFLQHETVCSFLDYRYD